MLETVKIVVCITQLKKKTIYEFEFLDSFIIQFYNEYTINRYVSLFNISCKRIEICLKLKYNKILPINISIWVKKRFFFHIVCTKKYSY